jgi:hypothetical protein
MQTWQTWVISGWVHILIGVVIGWVLFKRPEWVERAWTWIKDMVKG